MPEKNSNLLGQEETAERIVMVLNDVTDAVGATLGPGGGNVLIQDQMLQHFCTKDGYTVLSKMAFNNELDRTILGFLQRVSSRLNRTVGDGTTTAVLVAADLLKSLLESGGCNAATLREMKQTSEFLCSEIVNLHNTKGEYTDVVFQEILKDVATISANNDPVIGTIVADAFSKSGGHGVITVKEATGPSSSIKESSGIEHPRGMMHHSFANDQNREKFKAAGAVRIFMSREKLTADDVRMFSPLLQHCMASNQALVIMAPAFDEMFFSFLYKNKAQFQEKLVICPLDIAVESPHAREVFDDLVAFTSSTPFDINEHATLQDLFQSVETIDMLLGVVGEVTIEENKSLFSGMSPESFDAAKERHALILEALKDIEEDQVKDNIEELVRLKRRFSGLSESGMITIFVGGDSPQERRTTSFLVEDAVFAVQSAARSGIVPGCCMGVLQIISRIYGDGDKVPESEIQKGCSPSILHAIGTAYTKVVARIMANAGIGEIECTEIIKRCTDSEEVYNVVTGDFEPANETKVVSSTEADIETLRTAVSIVGLLAGSTRFMSSGSFVGTVGNAGPF